LFLAQRQSFPRLLFGIEESPSAPRAGSSVKSLLFPPPSLSPPLAFLSFRLLRLFITGAARFGEERRRGVRRSDFVTCRLLSSFPSLTFTVTMHSLLLPLIQSSYTESEESGLRVDPSLLLQALPPSMSFVSPLLFPVFPFSVSLSFFRSPPTRVV